MALGIYRTVPEAELVNMRDEALGELRARRTGQQTTTIGMGGKSFGFGRMTTTELHGELNEINWALELANPDVYGKRVTKTQADFSGEQLVNE